MPKVYIMDNPQPNAFATGRDPKNAAVAATTGILRALTREELAGVIGHELTHVKNRDTLTMTIAATIAGAISMLANFAFFFGGNRNNPLGFVGVLLAAITAPIAAMLIQMAISRTREYSADRGGAALCGNPLWLASALAKIEGGARRAPMITRRAQSRDRAALHRQSADRRAHGQPLLHASGDREPHRRLAGAGAKRRAGAPLDLRAGARSAAARDAHPGPWSRARRKARPLGLTPKERPRKSRVRGEATPRPRRPASPSA